MRFFRRYLFLAFVVYLFGFPNRIEAQTILERYRWLRTQEIAREVFNKNGHRMNVRPAQMFESKTDSIREWLRSLDPFLPDPPGHSLRRFQLDSWQGVDLRQEARFLSLFDETEWAFIGSSTRQRVDTTRTRDLRARMQNIFGPPTKTLAELRQVETLRRDKIIEFEYWFVLNDSIPVIVIDTNGPWDRGVVLASSTSHRHLLAEIKAVFLGQLVLTEDRKPFADYYFNPEENQWYVTGFDGASFFDARIVRPDLSRGRPDLAPYVKIEE